LTLEDVNDMKKLLWTFQILLTLAFTLFGLQKVFMPIPDLIAQGMLWIEDFPEWQVRAIGATEFLGVVGLNAPYFIKAIPRIVVPASAVWLGVTMLGAVATHIMRDDPALSIVITSMLFAMCVALAYSRFGELQERG
jgi:hypothetical protein